MIDLIHPNWPAPPKVRAVSTTRLGGVSSHQYDSLNLGQHVGDGQALVRSNRSALSQSLGLNVEPIWLNQTHGTIVLRCDEGLPSNALVDADGSITQVANRPCVVMTADCLPLLLCTKDGRQVAAVHAGWRGMADGIVEAAVDLFDAPGHELMAWCGPCIGPSAFEVGLEVKEQLGGPEHAYLPHQETSKVFANLPELARQRLVGVGVGDVYSCDLCTYSHPERFYSYRRDGQTGRMATLIWIEA